GKDHKAMELLLEHGANPNIQCFGKAPLLVACEGKDHKAMELLLKHGADLKIKNHSGETLLLIAYRKKDYDSMKLLLEHKANPNTMYDLERTLLLKAFEDQDHQAIELLLNNGANSNAKDKEDKTSLHYLCESRDGNNENSVKIATLLLRKGASPDLKDNRGNKPIDYISNSNSEIGKFMGAKDYYKIIMNASSGTMCLLGSTLFVSYTIFTSNKIVKVSAAFISIGFCVAVAYSAYHATSELLKKPSPEFIEARAEFLNSKQQQQKV
ncbi:MAG: ankyrin repeat domain-containing protein, partial [Wolbachia endosymbiont of Tyrophagus putrescentiae]|nr:ankyrin repeat domain-containing protein [Wolbachia endosymbiont of Tyrophagus putrescentiae]